jgi:DMSO/TMAO reductase YedYZ heme-binding membrane subunit
MEHRRLLFAIATGLLAVSAIGGAWVGAGWVWDAANAIGFAAAALMIFLHIETGAARNRPAPVAAFHARLHSSIALLALILVVAHVLVLLADDPVTIEYWKPSAPPYMLAGIVALLLLAAIVASSYPRPRRWLFANPAQFRRFHGIASIMLTAFVAWHIAGSALYLDTRFKEALFVVTLVGVPLWLIRRPDLQRPSVGAVRREPAEARRETFCIGAVALTMAVVFSALRNLL